MNTAYNAKNVNKPEPKVAISLSKVKFEISSPKLPSFSSRSLLALSFSLS